MKIVKLPPHFLLKGEHLNESIAQLNTLVESQNNKVAIDFSEIQETSKGDIMILLAQMEKSALSNGKTIYRFGKLPTNRKVKDLLKQMTGIDHFQETLDISHMPDSDKEKYVDVDFIDETVLGLKKIGIKEYYSPFNVFLTELIANAVEHGIRRKNINWWLTYEQDKTRTRKYTFVDMGIGIAKSHRKSGLSLRYWFAGDEKLVLDSFYGKLVSSTKKENRGKGLPQLFQMVEEGLVSDLQVITNRVSLYFEDGTLKSKKNVNFEGTFFSWTINLQNYQAWKNLK